MGKTTTIILFLTLTVNITFSQLGEGNIYDFLNLSYSSYSTGLGSKTVSLKGDKRNLSCVNPASINNNMDNYLTGNYSYYVGGINYGKISYNTSYENIGSFQLSMLYLNSGDIPRTDEFNNRLGDFSANNYAFLLSYSKQILENVTGGISIKPVISNIDTYYSFGLAFDFGAIYEYDEYTNFGLTIRNIGGQITKYTSQSSAIPSNYEIIFGTSIKLKNAPIRINLTAQQLQKFDISYSNDPEKKNSNSNSIIAEHSLFEKAFKHLIIGVEFFPSKNIFFSLGFNAQRSMELNSNNFDAYSGVSWGFGIDFEKFTIVYSGTNYNLNTTTNLSLSYNISKYF